MQQWTYGITLPHLDLDLDLDLDPDVDLGPDRLLPCPTRFQVDLDKVGGWEYAGFHGAKAMRAAMVQDHVYVQVQV